MSLFSNQTNRLVNLPVSLLFMLTLCCVKNIQMAVTCTFSTNLEMLLDETQIKTRRDVSTVSFLLHKRKKAV